MADITRCTEPGCPACESVIPFDATRADRYADLLSSIARDITSHPRRYIPGIDQPPSCWSAENPLRYDFPHTD